MVPRGATARRLRSISSPPTTSSTVSNPSGTAAVASASQSFGDRSSTRSAPSAVHSDALPAEQVTAMRAPTAFAI
jgi:hypothetical protein